jgi:hypothetical protein
MINYKLVENAIWNSIMVQLVKTYNYKEPLWYMCEQLYCEILY